MTHQLVSVHGGHSGQFCNHATNSLEEVICAYIDQGFAWVGITEHMPPTEDRFLFDEERSAGLSVETMAARFEDYMREGRRLQEKYADRLKLYIGFETEAYSGAFDYARELKAAHRPDYIIGGVHHIMDICFDSGREDYQRAMAAAGGEEALYCRYFDLQFDMLQTLKPDVVAHFDLIRIFDEAYPQRWQHADIAHRIRRNLELIRDLDLILDFNVAALRKGAAEPYVSEPILKQAADLGIAVIPGDDSHGVSTVGQFVAEGAERLARAGVNTRWRKPA